MYSNRFAVIALLVLLSFGILSAYSDLGGGWCRCTGCADCEDALNNNTACTLGAITDGTNYNVPSNCIDNPENFTDKTLDLNGSTIAHAGGVGFIGIQAINKTNITVKNGRITGFINMGIYLNNCTNGTIRNITIDNIQIGEGIHIEHWSSFINISNVTVESFTDVGIYIESSFGNEIWDAKLNHNEYGIELVSSQNNSIHDVSGINNTNGGASGAAFYCWHDSGKGYMLPINNTFERVNGSANNIGIHSDDCSRTTVREGEFWNNSLAGAYFESSNLTVFENVTSYNNTYGFRIFDSSYSNFTGSVVHSNSRYGFHLTNSSMNRIFKAELYNTSVSATPSGDEGSGLYAKWCPNVTLENITSYNNSRHGMYVFSCNETHGYNNTLYNNTRNGMYVREDSASSIFMYNDIFNNSRNGLYVRGSRNSISLLQAGFLWDNIYNNTLSGINFTDVSWVAFYGSDTRENGLDGAYGQNSENVFLAGYLSGPTFRSQYNARDGIRLDNVDSPEIARRVSGWAGVGVRHNGGDGIAVYDSDNVEIYSPLGGGYISVQNNSGNGILLSNAPSRENFTILNVDIWDNGESGINATRADYLLVHSSNIHGNGLDGLRVNGCPDSNLTLSEIYNNSGNGLNILTSSDFNATSNHFFNNSRDIVVGDVAGVDFDVSFSGLIIDNPLGNYINYTNISMEDSVSSSSQYSINWTTNSSALPFGTTSFENKYVNISTLSGTVSLDQVTWHWTDAEASTYNEQFFKLFYYNASGWGEETATLDTAANTITANNLVPSSDYTILEDVNCPVINVSGNYVFNNDMVGAPNSPSAFVCDYACVVVDTSDVLIDFNGSSITGNGTTGSSAGIFVNPGADNVTVMNSPAISNYSYGAYYFQSDDGVIRNITTYNNSEYGITISITENHRILDVVSFNNSNHGLFVSTSDYGFVNNSQFYNNSGSGIRVSSSTETNISFVDSFNNSANGLIMDGSSDNTRVENSSFFLNNWNGVHFSSGASDNYLYNCTAYNNSIDGFRMALSTTTGNMIYGGESHGNRYGVFYQNPGPVNSVYNVTLYDNLADFITYSLGDAFTVDARNITFTNPTGSLDNYTVLDIQDDVSANEAYGINWTQNQTSLPEEAISFENKYVEIGNGTSTAVSIDELVWHWGAGEEAGYAPSQFKLVRYNTSEGWSLVNETPDTGARTLSTYDLDPASSDYGILQYVANVSIIKLNQTPFPPSEGGMVEFNITINNTGNVTLDTVQVVDELPAGLQWAGESPNPDSCTNGECTWNNVGPLAPGASTIIYVNATVDAGVATPGNRIVNVTNYVNATFDSNLTSPGFAEDYENATVYFANLTITKTDVSSYPPVPGATVEYRIDVENTGNVTLNTVRIDDELPAWFNYSNADPLPDSTGSHWATWDDVGPLAPGATTTIYLNATINESAPEGAQTNTAAGEGAPVNGDNVTGTDDATTTVVYPSISVSKTNPPTADVGDNVTYILEVTNTGPVNLTVSVNDTIPAGLQFLNASPANTSSSGNTIYWEDIFVDLTPGSSEQIEYNVSVLSNGVHINEVWVTGEPLLGEDVTDDTRSRLSVGQEEDDDGGKKLDEMYIVVSMPKLVYQEVTLTVMEEDSTPLANAEVKIKTDVPGYWYWYHPGETNSDGEVTFTPDYVGPYHAYAEKSGYYDAQDEFSVSEAKGECMINQDCHELYNDCFFCNQVDHMCSLNKGAECGFDEDCQGYTPEKVEDKGTTGETEDEYTDGGTTIEDKPEYTDGEAANADDIVDKKNYACIDCQCTPVECLTDDDCEEGQECIDYECVGEPEEEEGCESDADCASDEYCNQDTGECEQVECPCGQIIDHECSPYECCANSTCLEIYGDNYYCNLDSHECEPVEEEEEEEEGDQPIDVDVPGEVSVGQPVQISVTSDGEPVGDAEVTVVIQGTPYGAGKTGPSGDITFIPEEEGDYTVVVSKPGFDTGEKNFKATSEPTIWDTIIRGAWILLFLLILAAVIYVLWTRKKKRRPKE